MTMKRVILFAAALGVLASAATITTLNTVLPDIGPLFTPGDQAVITSNATISNTNFANLNAALSTLGIATVSLTDCTTATPCTNTAATVERQVIVRGTLVTGTPSTFALTGISPAFTSATSYNCVAQDTTTIANNIGVLTAGYVSGSAVTFTGPNTNTDTFRGVCTGF